MSSSSARKSHMRLTVDDRGTSEVLLSGKRGHATTPAGWGVGSWVKSSPPMHRNLLRCLVALVLALAIGLPVLANQAETHYKEGQKAEAKNDFDSAYKAYEEASKLEPKNAKYLAAITRLRFYAAMQHLHAGTELRDAGKLNDAAVEFERAVAIDPTSMVAKAELQKTADMIKVQ